MKPFSTQRQTLCCSEQILLLLFRPCVNFQSAWAELATVAVWMAAAARSQMADPFHPNRLCEHNPADSIGIWQMPLMRGRQAGHSARQFMKTASFPCTHCPWRDGGGSDELESHYPADTWASAVPFETSSCWNEGHMASHPFWVSDSPTQSGGQRSHQDSSSFVKPR